MGDWLSAAVAGSFDLIGGGLNAAYSADAAKKAYRRQKKLMLYQNAWTERMANTAHQREVKDLRDAGLNPILSATGGNGAASPVVSAPSVASASGNPFAFNNLGKTLSNSAEAKQARAAEKLADARVENEKRVTDAEVDKARSEADLNRARSKEIRSGVPLNRYPMGPFEQGVDAIVRAYDSTLHHAASSKVARGEREVPLGVPLEGAPGNYSDADVVVGKYRGPDGLVHHGGYVSPEKFEVIRFNGKRHIFRKVKRR